MSDIDEIRQQLELLNDEELVSIFREHDTEKWRPEVFDIVGAILTDRGISPAEAPEEEADIPEGAVSVELVTVAEYFNYMDAETDRLALEAEVEETRPRNVDRVAPRAHIEAGADVGGELARIEFAFLGEGHQGGRLVITEARIRAGPDLDRGQVGIGQDSRDGRVQSGFEHMVHHERRVICRTRS